MDLKEFIKHGFGSKRSRLIFYVWMIFVLIAHNYLLFQLVQKAGPVVFASSLLVIGILLLITIYISYKIAKNVGIENVCFQTRPIYLLLAGVISISIIFNSDILFGLEFAKFRFAALFLTRLLEMLLISFLFFITSLVVGRKMLGLFRIKESGKAENYLFSIGLGTGFLSYLVFLFAVLKLIYPITIYLVVLACLLIFYKDIVMVLKPVFIKKDFSISIGKNFRETLVSSLLISIFIILLVFSMANVLSGDWDTFHQYLTFPSVYAQNHGLVYFPYHPHWGFPQGTEMLYLMGLELGGMGTPFFMNYIFFGLALAVLYLIFANTDKKKTIWIMAIAATIPFVLVFQGGYLKVESLFMFYTALALLALMKFFTDPQKNRYFILFAVFCGLMVSVKYTALFAIAGFLAAFVITRRTTNISYRKIIIFCSIIAVLFLPWGVKNMVYYKNAFYPIISGGQDYFSRELGINCHNLFIENCQEDMYLAYGNTNFKFNSSYLSNISIGIQNLLLPNQFNIADAGPWLIVFLPVLVIGFFKIKNYYINFLYYFCVVYFLIWLIFCSGQTWYLIPAILAMLIILSYIFDEFFTLDKYPLAKISIVIWLIYVLIVQVLSGDFKQKVQYSRGQADLEAALEQAGHNWDDNSRVDWYKMWRYIDSDVLDRSSSQKVYGFMDTQGYYIKDSNINFIPDFFGYLFRCIDDSGSAYEKLKMMNVGYFVFDARYIYAYSNERDPQEFKTWLASKKFTDFLAIHGREIHKEGMITLFSLE